MASLGRRPDTDRGHDHEEAVAEVARTAPVWSDGEGASCLSVSKGVYSLRAILATAYKFSDRCVALVDEDSNERWALFLRCEDEAALRTLLPMVVNELSDQQLRDQLEREFGNVRALLVAQAFSEGNLLAPEGNAGDNQTDP